MTSYLSWLGWAGALMTLLWMLSIRVKDASIADQAWGLLFVSQAAFYAGGSDLEWDARKILMTAMAGVWGLRLFLHIHFRSRGQDEDPRYRSMRLEHGERKFRWYSLFSVFLLQTLFASIVGLPLLAVGIFAGSPGLTGLDLLAVAVWCVGLGFETVADWQLARFKRTPGNKGRILDRGLWALSRHPNYFGEFLIWWGFYGLSLSIPGSWWWTIVGPCLMSILLLKVSGVPLLDKGMAASKPGFDQYLNSVPAFFPAIKRLGKGRLR